MAVTTKEPEEYALALLAHFKLARIGNISEFAITIGLKIREVDSTSFEGALIRIPNRPHGIIAVKRTIPEAGRKVFTIAHEIGHFILPGHGATECYCTPDDIDSWKAHVARTHETAANRFASELLIPKREIYAIVNKRGATITLAKELSLEFQTSLTAAAIKCVLVTEEECALVWSANNEIQWCVKSEKFWHYLPPSRLANDTLASRLYNDSTVREREGDILVSSWIDSDRFKRDAFLWEDSIYLPNYDGVLTMITIN